MKGGREYGGRDWDGTTYHGTGSSSRYWIDMKLEKTPMMVQALRVMRNIHMLKGIHGHL